MTPNRHLLTPAKYSELAGSDWPTYSDYAKGIKYPSKEIELEILNFENENRAHYQEQTNKQRHESSHKNKMLFIWFSLIPAIIGTVLYFYLGGGILKFFVLFLCFRALNIFHILTVHRWLTHNQFESKFWARPILLWFSVAGAFIPPGRYVQSHWAHHKDSDTDLDPYPPTVGLINLSIGDYRNYKKYPFGRWIIAPDIKFVFRNFWLLWGLNVAIFAYIDIDIFLLSFLFVRVYAIVDNGLSNFLLHDGFRTKLPVNSILSRYPIIGYTASLFFAIELLHAVHHGRPWIFNQAKHVPGAIDIGYWLMRPFAKTERE